MPEKGKDDIPSTLKRSPAKAQRTWKKTHDSAAKEYGNGRRAHQTAYAALKHEFEKVGDHWEPKGHKGPSDPKAKTSYKNQSKHSKAKSYGGVDVEGSTKKDLIDKARKVGITGYSRMSKDELGQAINKANRRQTAKARQ